jgi:hypothetical protein
MTDDEIAPFVGKPVRITLADGRVLAGTLHGHGDAGHHGHSHYEVVSDPVQRGGEKVREMIHGGGRIATIQPAPDDPAAVE